MILTRDQMANQIAGAETVLRHGLKALATGDRKAVRFALALLEEEQALGSIMAAKILEEEANPKLKNHRLPRAA